MTKHLILLKIKKYDQYQWALPSNVYNFFNEKSAVTHKGTFEN